MKEYKYLSEWICGKDSECVFIVMKIDIPIFFSWTTKIVQDVYYHDCTI